MRHLRLFENFENAENFDELEADVNAAVQELFPRPDIAIKAYKADAEGFYKEITDQIVSDTGGDADLDSYVDAIDSWVNMNEQSVGDGEDIKIVDFTNETRPRGFSSDKAFKQGHIMVQRVGGSTSWNVAINGIPKGRVLDAYTTEQALKKTEKL